MIHVFDRFQADEYFPLDPTVAIRCMSSPSGLKELGLRDYEPLRGKYVNVLGLVFDDITSDYGDLWDYVAFNVDMAKRISNFVRTEKFKDIMIHCDYGASRSCAVGAALADCCGFEYDSEIRNRKRRSENDEFNMFVYDILCDVLIEEFRKNLS